MRGFVGCRFLLGEFLLVGQFLLSVFSFKENVIWVGQFVFPASTESIKVERIGLGSLVNGCRESKIGFGLD